MFESGEEPEVNDGLSIMNELVVPCIPLLLLEEMEEKDMVAVEDMRNRWCSYLGQEMERKCCKSFLECTYGRDMKKLMSNTHKNTTNK